MKIRTVVALISFSMLFGSCGGDLKSQVPTATPITTVVSLRPPLTPPEPWASKTYAELEDRLGWRILRPRDKTFANSVVQREVTETIEGELMLAEHFTRMRSDTKDLVFTQFPGESAIALPEVPANDMLIAGFEVRAFDLQQRGVQLRFPTGAMSANRLPVYGLVEAQTVEEGQEFIEQLAFDGADQ
jgi:hypothetical protein